MGSGRADRLGQGQVDLRCLQPSKRGSQQQASVDSFMVVLYNSVAEHLPDKRPGDARKLSSRTSPESF